MYFTNEEHYRDIAQTAKHDPKKKTEASKINEEFNRTGLQVLGVKVGQFGQMKSLVAVDQKCWDLIVRIINRDHEEPRKAGKGKGGGGKEGKKRTPIESRSWTEQTRLRTGGFRMKLEISTHVRIAS